jgi:hypothetical protein
MSSLALLTFPLLCICSINVLRKMLHLMMTKTMCSNNYLSTTRQFHVAAFSAAWHEQFSLMAKTCSMLKDTELGRLDVGPVSRSVLAPTTDTAGKVKQERLRH